MVDLVFSLLFLVVGVFFIYSAYKSSKTKEIKININKIINPAMIKYKEQNLKVHCKWNYILGVIATTEGVVGLISFYIPSIGFGFSVLNIILVLALAIYMFKVVRMLCQS